MDKTQKELFKLLGIIIVPERILEDYCLVLKTRNDHAKYRKIVEEINRIFNRPDVQYAFFEQNERHPLHEDFRHIVKRLLENYKKEDVSMDKAWNYLQALSEYDLDSTINPRDPFRLKDKEALLFADLLDKPLRQEMSVHYRHLLTIFFLYYEVINQKEELQKIVNRFKHSGLTLNVAGRYKEESVIN